jgi:hypothetical protein
MPPSRHRAPVAGRSARDGTAGFHLALNSRRRAGRRVPARVRPSGLTSGRYRYSIAIPRGRSGARTALVRRESHMEHRRLSPNRKTRPTGPNRCRRTTQQVRRQSRRQPGRTAAAFATIREDKPVIANSFLEPSKAAPGAKVAGGFDRNVDIPNFVTARRAGRRGGMAGSPIGLVCHVAMTDRGQLRALRDDQGDEFGFVAHRRPRFKSRSRCSRRQSTPAADR